MVMSSADRSSHSQLKNGNVEVTCDLGGNSFSGIVGINWNGLERENERREIGDGLCTQLTRPDVSCSFKQITCVF